MSLGSRIPSAIVARTALTADELCEHFRPKPDVERGRTVAGQNGW